MKVDANTCVGCGGCISGYDGDKSCPTHAITIKGDKADINQELCVKCGQCIELCALGAISKG